MKARLRLSRTGCKTCFTTSTSALSGPDITYTALAQGSSSNVVIALRNGFVTTGSPWPFSTPESQVAADLLGGSEAQQTDLVNFFLNNLSDFTQMGSQGGQVGTFWEFSNAVNVGSVSATASPKLSTTALMALAFGALILGGRRLRGSISRSRSDRRSYFDLISQYRLQPYHSRDGRHVLYQRSSNR